KSFAINTPVTFRGNPGPWPRTLPSFVSPVGVTGQATKQTVNVSGTVSNVMVGTTITIGPDPFNGNTEQVTVQGVDTSNPSNPGIVGIFTKNYNPGAPISWTNNVLYNPRNDPAVVPHFTVIQ